jgi:hypothetical protein
VAITTDILCHQAIPIVSIYIDNAPGEQGPVASFLMRIDYRLRETRDRGIDILTRRFSKLWKLIHAASPMLVANSHWPARGLCCSPCCPTCCMCGSDCTLDERSPANPLPLSSGDLVGMYSAFRFQSSQPSGCSCSYAYRLFPRSFEKDDPGRSTSVILFCTSMNLLSSLSLNLSDIDIGIDNTPQIEFEDRHVNVSAGDACHDHSLTY